jgi:hypothetical protein
MRVGTIGVVDGNLKIGTNGHPVNARAEIIFDGDGPIDRLWDPEQLSIGLVAQSPVEINAVYPAPYARLATGAPAGATELRLDEIPEGWQVGDPLVICGTHFERWGQMESERVTISAIGQSMIDDRQWYAVNIYPALRHDHTHAEFTPHVANMRRNVVFRSWNSAFERRGHVMFMAESNRVSGASFFDLGRTRKDIPLDDFLLDDKGRRQLHHDGTPIQGDRHNIRGRYPLHLHRNGTGSSAFASYISGNVVDGSPSWGIVQHDSEAWISENVVLGSFGAGIVAESGNEDGSWSRNLVIDTPGTGTVWTAAAAKKNSQNHDMASRGYGFWSHSRLLNVDSNIVAGHGAAAYAYVHRGVDMIDPTVDQLTFKRIFSFEVSGDTRRVPIRSFSSNESYCGASGLLVMKRRPKQEHGIRSMLREFTARECLGVGCEFQYASKYTLLDFDLSASPGNQSEGILLGNAALDFTVTRPTVRGFGVGIAALKKIPSDPQFSDDWMHLVISPDAESNQVEFWNIGSSEVVDMDELPLDTPKGLTIVDDDQTNFLVSGANVVWSINGVLHDSTGSHPLGTLGGTHEINVNRAALLKTGGYYTDRIGMPFFWLDEPIADRRTGQIFFVRLKIEIDPTYTSLLKQMANNGAFHPVEAPR